jgi:NADH:ubiquinone oxidoreductase subunit 6 (subunit J)
MTGVSPFVFWAISAIIIGSALAVVLFKNLVHSAIFLIITFVGVAGIYAMLEFDFLAAVQILIYAGAIAILLVFGVMLTRRGDIRESNPFNKYKFVSIIISAAFLFVTVYMIFLNDLPSLTKEAGNSIELIASVMFTDFVVPFEAAAILLLVAMIGAVMIARGGNKSSD